MANMSFTNNAATTLSNSISNSATTLTVTAGTGSLFPAISGSQYFYCTLANNTTTVEIVKVTARSSDTFTVVRAQDNTSASAWNAGDKIELRLVAANLNNFPKLNEANTFSQAQTFSVPIAPSSGGTGLSSSGTSGNVLTSNGTSWVSQALPIRSGSTTVTLTSSSPNATLTAASSQYILIQNDSTKPIGASVTLPDMTTLVTGVNYFSFTNSTPYIVALKDSGGTVREFIAPGAGLVLQIQNNGTATGQWNIAFPANAASVDSFYSATVFTNYKVNSGYAVNLNAQKVVRLDNSNFAYVWTEFNSASSYVIYYARLCTYNSSTKAFTLGNTVTCYTAPNNTQVGANNGGIDFDSDGAGHALVLGYSNGGVNNANSVYFGLSVSGGTLYATSAVATTTGVGACYAATIQNMFVSYLGSNNAFAFGWLQGDTGSASIYIRGCTVTGTTAPVITNSANNTTIAAGATAYAYGARTDLTTLVFGANGTLGRAVAYTPASNTFSIVTRTNQARLDIEQGASGGLSSFAEGGYMYSSGKSVYGNTVYDVTNVGAVGVTATVSTGFSYKANLSAAYLTVLSPVTGLSTARSSIYVNGTSIIALDGLNRLQCDPSQTTLNLQKSTGVGYPSATYLLSTTTPISVTFTQSAAGLTSTVMSSSAIGGDMATPITL
jgi:hypothetical protein